MATDALSRTDKSKRRPVTPHLPHLKPLSSRGQFQSGQPEAGVPRRWAGREMAKNFFGHAPMQQFLSIAFPSVAYVAPDEDDLNRYKTLLRAIPAGLNILERDMYGPLVTAVTDIAADVSHQLRIDNSSSKRGEVWPGGPTLTPDVTIHTLDTMEKSWAHGISFLEVKRTTKEDPLSLSEDSQSISLHNVEIWNQIQHYATIALEAAPRCFYTGVGLFGETARLFYWDRSGVLVSEAFAFKEDPSPLVSFLQALNDYGKGGLDTTACRPFRPDAKARRLVRDGYNKALKTRIMEEYKPLTPGKDYVDEGTRVSIRRPSSGAEEEFLTIGRPIFSYKSAVGRGTRVWIAVKNDGSPTQPFIVKDTWYESGRWSEGDIYRRICEGGRDVFGVARFYDAYDVDEPNSPCIHRTAAGRIKSMAGKCSLPERVHHRCILSSVGIPLDKFSSTRQLMGAVRDAIKGLQELSDLGILHRDISVNNIMISVDPADENGARGFLIDPELAFHPDMPGSEEQRKFITGTFQFLAIKRLQQHHGDHEPWHDLESVFWVVLWLVLRHTRCTVSHGGKERDGKDCVSWIFDAEDGSGKMMFLAFGEVIVQDNEPLTDCLATLQFLVHTKYMRNRRLRRLIEQANRDTLDCQLTHQNFLSAIDKALGEGEWPQEDKAQVFTPAGRPKNEDNKEISRMLSSNISQVLSPLPFADSNLGSPPSNRSPRAGEIGSAANHLETRSHAPVQVLSESSTGPGMAADPRSSCPAPSQSGNATIPPTRGGPEEPAAASSSKMRSKSGDVLSRPMSEPSATSGRPSAAGGSQASSQPGNTLLPMSSSAQSKLSTVYSSATRSRSDALLSVALRNSESRRNLPSRSTALVAPEAAQVGAEPRSPLVAAGDVPLLSGVPQPAHSSPPRVSGSSQSVWRRSERTSDAPLDTSSKVLRSREGLAGSSSGAGGTRSVHSSRSQGGASSLKRRGEQSSGSAKPSWK